MKEEIKEAADKMVEKNSKLIGSYPNELVLSIAKSISISECQSLIDELTTMHSNMVFIKSRAYALSRISHYQDIKNYLQTL